MPVRVVAVPCATGFASAMTQQDSRRKTTGEARGTLHGEDAIAGALCHLSDPECERYRGDPWMGPTRVWLPTTPPGSPRA